ncbi:ribosome maturation factor RimM [Alicyclobacillus mengziensis]|uniref:Ribosome maturation factor RimM n=1 Tax=Alicyclobacillus mengziensis TaxID=2931921 RepID=A0A9X7W2Z2_9BACL|nr:ribosome maturation factor RimM [Alicyclobacillus mengziensis]
MPNQDRNRNNRHPDNREEKTHSGEIREEKTHPGGNREENIQQVENHGGQTRAPRQYFTVGVIAGTHALRGEVKVLSRTDFPEKRFKKGAELYLREPGKSPRQALKVAASRSHKQFWLVLFEGVTSINDVDKWKGLELVVPESELVPLPEGTYYIHQLVGLHVVTDEGHEVGTIREVLQPGANDVYVVRGSLQKADVLIPAIPDCVLSVDLDAGQMFVHLLPGLLADDDGPADDNRVGRQDDRFTDDSVASGNDAAENEMTDATKRKG